MHVMYATHEQWLHVTCLLWKGVQCTVTYSTQVHPPVLPKQTCSGTPALASQISLQLESAKELWISATIAACCQDCSVAKVASLCQ